MTDQRLSEIAERIDNLTAVVAQGLGRTIDGVRRVGDNTEGVKDVAALERVKVVRA